jgi:hypothetical protein
VILKRFKYRLPISPIVASSHDNHGETPFTRVIARSLGVVGKGSFRGDQTLQNLAFEPGSEPREMGECAFDSRVRVQIMTSKGDRNEILQCDNGSFKRAQMDCGSLMK